MNSSSTRTGSYNLRTFTFRLITVLKELKHFQNRKNRGWLTRIQSSMWKCAPDLFSPLLTTQTHHHPLCRANNWTVSTPFIVSKSNFVLTIIHIWKRVAMTSAGSRDSGVSHDQTFLVFELLLIGLSLYFVSWIRDSTLELRYGHRLSL